MSGAEHPSNRQISFGFNTSVKEISNTLHIWRAIAKLINAIPVVLVSSSIKVSICLLFSRLHGITSGVLVKSLPNKTEEKISNDLTPSIATLVEVNLFAP